LFRKNKKNKPIDSYEFTAVSSDDMTGLMPTPPLNEHENEFYNDIYTLRPTAEPN